MLNLLDESLGGFLRAAVPLPDDVVVSFEAPDRDWAAGVAAQPTLNLFLHDVRRNDAQRQAGWEQVTDESGRLSRRPLPDRVDCHYLLTVWTSGPGDEHRLLGEALTALLAHRLLPQDHLVGALAGLRPLPALELAGGDGHDGADFWSALGGRLRLGIRLIVTIAVQPTDPTAPGQAPVTRVDSAVEARSGAGGRSVRQRVAGRTGQAPVGGLVRSPRGAARVRSDGAFLVPAETDDRVVVEHGDGRTSAGHVPGEGPVEVSPDEEGSPTSS